MVDNTVHITNVAHAGGVRAADFVGRTTGKLRDNYRIGKVLGSGAFGEVRMCVHRESGAQRAVKVLRKSNMDDDEKRMLFNEINILKEIDHPNIIKIFGVEQDADYIKPSGKKSKATFLAIELAPNGELFDYVAETGQFSEPECRFFMSTILQALHHCHKAGYAHRDLKPENIFFGENHVLKLADFGFATLLNGRDGKKKLHTPLGTQGYMAPEICY